MMFMSFLMLFPLGVSIIYEEKTMNLLAFIIPIGIFLIGGKLLSFKKAKSRKFGAREGFIIVALIWLLMSLIGCLPFIISKEIPNFFDAFFEITSGFTTTGSSIVTDVTSLSKSILFWRSFSHWIGGMGILVLILALIPESKEGSSMHILRAESPGPQVGKLVSKMKVTSRILYLIYLGLTILEVIFLWSGPDKQMDLFHSIIYSLGTAGTGGLAIDPYSLEFYSSYSQYIIAIFMIIFGINFTIFYLLLVGNFKEVLKNEEIKMYFIVIAISVIIITLNIYNMYNNLETAFRHSLFQVSSIISTTGYSTTNFDMWPSLSKTIILILMVFGGCAGSTAGGAKLSRIMILAKSSKRKLKMMISPRKVETVKMNGKSIDESTIEGVQSYMMVYFIIFIVCGLLISVDGKDILTNLTASLACISNVGPGFNLVGPYGSYSVFSDFSKAVLSLEMIAGRLELFPMLLLLYPKTWMNK